MKDLIKVRIFDAHDDTASVKRYGGVTNNDNDDVSRSDPEPEADAEEQLEQKKQRLREWLQSTLRLKRILTTAGQNNLDDEIPNEVEEEEEEEDEFEGIGDPYCQLRVQDIQEVEGRTDRRGLPCGRAAVSLHTGDEVYGSWRGGRREGLGNTTGPRLEARGVRLVQGYYSGGRLQGPGHVKLTNGCQFDCRW